MKKRVIYALLLLTLPTVVVVVVVLVLMNWRIPTRVQVQLTVNRAVFIVGGDESTAILNAPLRFQSITVEHFADITLSPAQLDVADPAQYILPEDQYSEDAWTSLTVTPPVVITGEDETLQPAVTLESTKPEGMDLGGLDLVRVKPGAQVILELRGDRGEDLTIQVEDQESFATLSMSGSFQLISDYSQVNGVSDFSYQNEDSLTYRARLPEDTPLIEVNSQSDSLVLLLTVSPEKAENLFYQRGIWVTSLEFVRQGLKGEIETTFIKGVEGYISYPEYPGIEKVSFTSPDFLGLDKLEKFRIEEIALDRENKGIQFRLNGVAGHIRTGSREFPKDHRLTRFDTLWQNSKLAILFSIVVWGGGTMMGGYRLSQEYQEYQKMVISNFTSNLYTLHPIQKIMLLSLVHSHEPQESQFLINETKKIAPKIRGEIPNLRYINDLVFLRILKKSGKDKYRLSKKLFEHLILSDFDNLWKQTIQEISLPETFKIEDFDDIAEIRSAIGNNSFRNYQRLAEAICRRMQIADATLIDSLNFINGTVWEVSLPAIGLKLRTRKAILFLRQKEEDRAFYEHLVEITTEKDAQFLIILDIADIRSSSMISGPQIIWFRTESLIEMVTTPEEELLSWLGRFITTQVDITPLLPYQTKGRTELFRGRDYELTRLTGGTRRGGIIIGAHRSGKTSLLYRLRETLEQRGRKVTAPITMGGIENLRFFFEKTLNSLRISPVEDLTPASWSSAIRTYGKEGKCPVFLFDEVDDLLKLDAEAEFVLGQQMRALQNDGECEFYLVGHSMLRKAIALEEGPFRNFAEEIILTGLTESAALRLIQEPIKDIGFVVTHEQAHRIFEGTAGVPVLIQEFCIRLLRSVRDFSKTEIESSMISEVEELPEYLSVVFKHYEYAQEWDSMFVMLITAIIGEVTRHHIMREFSRRDILIKRDRLDEILDFLVKFGVLEEFEAGSYRVLPQYLMYAIKTRDPYSLLDSEIQKGKNKE